MDRHSDQRNTKPEAESALWSLQHIARSAESHVVRYLARRELRSLHSGDWPEIALPVRQEISDISPVPAERLYDILVGMPWEERLKDWHAEDARIDELCRKAAEAFWQEHGTSEAVVEALLQAVAAFSGTGREPESQIGRLVHALVLASPDSPRDIIAQFLSRPAGRHMLRPALLAAHERDPAMAEALVMSLATSEYDTVRVSALDAVQWMLDRALDFQGLLGLTRSLSHDPTPLVRGASARVLRRLAKRTPVEALEILTEIDWGSEPWLADSILGVLNPQFGLDPARLTDDRIDSLLSRVERLQTFEGDNYQLFQFIAFRSASNSKAEGIAAAATTAIPTATVPKASVTVIRAV